jgi:hypothetical protein
MMDTIALINLLDALQRGDWEARHAEADEALLAWLDAHGYAEVAEAYRAARRRVGGAW